MFTRLFAESGLSLDRLRALVEVGASGSIVRAAGSDPSRQSLYSRQLKELEDFFRTGLVERYGKGIRLTSRGRELARISRFFLLGLSNFQRGCLAEAQMYRIAAPASFIEHFLAPLLPGLCSGSTRTRFAMELEMQADTVERRLQDLTLDFGVLAKSSAGRPLQLRRLGDSALILWIPKKLCRTEKGALQELEERALPLAWPEAELPGSLANCPWSKEPALICSTFLQAKCAVETGNLATLLPEFLTPRSPGKALLRIEVSSLRKQPLEYAFAWNPRLLRLNVHAAKERDRLVEKLTRSLKAVSTQVP